MVLNNHTSAGYHLSRRPGGCIEYSRYSQAALIPHERRLEAIPSTDKRPNDTFTILYYSPSIPSTHKAAKASLS